MERVEMAIAITTAIDSKGEIWQWVSRDMMISLYLGAWRMVPTAYKLLLVDKEGT
jgi:hypothetical protein